MAPTTSSPTTAERYAAAAAPLTDLVDAVPGDRWDAASPCEGWTARDVVRHLVETQRDFLTGHGVDLGPAPDLDADPAAAWRAHRQAAGAAASDPAVTGTAFDGYFGPTTVGETLERFYVFDLVAHRWDLARAVGARTGASFTDAELDQLEAGIASFGDAIRADGICGPAVDVPAGADRETKVLALLGRRA
jgi:uncharacterized protein (TIGR03086 family)